MKKNILILLMLTFVGLWANEFEVFVELNSFLDESNNTINDVVFKAPYENLGYVEKSGNRVSILKIEYSIMKGDKILEEDVLTNNIIQTKKSEKNYLIDKISMTVRNPGLKIRINFIDDLTHNEFKWERELDCLKSDALVSSIEFESSISPKGKKYEKFVRGKNLYLPNPHHNYFLPNQDSLFFYYEFYNLAQQKGVSKISETVNITQNDSLIYQQFHSFNLDKTRGSNNYKIDISDYKTGLYNIQIQVVDIYGRKTSKIDDVFVIRKMKTGTVSVFNNIDDDYRLIKYFLSNSQKNVWRKLSLEGKLNFIDHFWKVSDTNPATTKNEFLEMIETRVGIANKKYGSINNIGWQTDMGRIIIRNGAPDETTIGETNSSYSRYVAKQYIIWKYYTDMKIYLFIDKMNNGRYELVYIRNDDLENTRMDWEKLMGDDFDTSELDF